MSVPGRLRALGLDERDARGLAGVLFLTGTETVASFLPRLVGLLADSGLLAVTARAYTLGRLDELVDEALRVTVPTPVTVRRAAADAQLGPVAVRAGERVLVLTVNAVWSGRSVADLRQLWFGAGPHFCLGRSIAQAQAKALVRVLLDACPAGGRIEVTRRRPRRQVLIPSWDELTVQVG